MRDQFTEVYTDGACQGNPGPGGWAWAVPGGHYRSGAEPRSTNQRMEIKAALDAVTSLDGPLEVVSDSTYVVNCFRDRWWENWIARGWVNKARKPIANRDLWEPLIEAYRADPGRVRFRWVKGHATDPMNDLVDRLAVEAAATQVGREGTGQPEDLGPPDRPGRARRADPPAAEAPLSGSAAAAPILASGPAVRARPAAPGPGPQTGGQPAPPGHLLLVTGLKPPGLGGYGETAVASGVRRRLAEILAAKRALHPDLTVLTGLGLGSEQLAAEAAAASRVPYVAVLAYPGFDQVWSAASRQHFARLLEGAAGTVVLDARQPATRQAAGGALARRDAWLARHADEAVVVWDGDDSAVGRTVRSLRDHLGEEDVWVLEPPA